MAQQPQEPQVNRKRMVIFGLVLGAIVVFMYVSIIIKTATMGP